MKLRIGAVRELPFKSRVVLSLVLAKLFARLPEKVQDWHYIVRDLN